MAETVKIGVVGAGYWGPNLIRNFAELPNCKLEQVCDLDPKRLAKIKLSHPTTTTTTSYDEMVNNPNIDGIVIATSASTHKDLTLQALKGKKHVLVEKPLSYTVADAEAMVHAAETAQRILMVGHTFEYNPAVEKLKQIIHTEKFGKPLYMYGRRLNLGRIREDVNVLWNLAPHDISIILYLIDEEPVSVRCLGTSFLQPGIEDVAFMYLEFASGLVAHVHVGWLDPSKVRTLTVVGSQQMAIYDDVDNEAKLKIYDKGAETQLVTDGGIQEYSIRLRAGDILIPKIDGAEPLKKECQHFVDCIRTGSKPKTDGLNGLRVTKILDAAQRSLKSGGEKVKL
jgi:predicted dehydrogenase